jgi:regulator of replication initiation timing
MEASTAIDASLLRAQKAFDTLKRDKTKLADENAALKKQLAELKARNSRVHRIPKKDKDKDKAGTEVAAAPAEA